MTSAVDFSNSRIDPSALKGAGVTHVIRYVDRVGWPKSLTRAEAESYLAVGLRVVLNFEEQANQATFGSAQGRQDAAAANGYANAIGAPQSAEIYYSCDTSATVEQVLPYFQGARAAGGRPVSFYGGLHVGLSLKFAGYAANVWCANAASWSGYSSWDQMAAAARAQGATILQHLDHPLAGIDPHLYDFNEVLGAPLAWGDPYTPPTPTPSKRKHNVYIVNSAGHPAALVSGSTVRHIGESSTLKQFTDQGVPSVTVDATEYGRLTAGTAVS